MILVDTSVWIDHLRRGNARLVDALEAEAVLCHPFVIGELACGSLKQRAEFLDLLNQLPQAQQASHAEAKTVIDARRLFGRGLGFTDVHLLASAMLDGATLFTLDQRLAHAARAVGVAAQA